jgi:predicted metal-dependent peptidase
MEPAELFTLARLRATIAWPQLAPAVWALRTPVPVQGLAAKCGGAVATDMRWRVYYDPEEIKSFTPGQAAATLVHEAWHCLHGHAERVRDAGIEPRWQAAVNAATDASINGDMERCAPAPLWPYEVITPKVLAMPVGLPWEQYYPAAKLLCGPDAKARGGSSADGMPRDWEAPSSPGDTGADRAERESVRRQVARAISRMGPYAAPAGWRRWASEIVSGPRVPWQQLLGAALRGGLATASGMVDYSRQVPSRRQAVTPVLLPTLRRPVATVDVLVDTSGSMGADELGRALAEVEGIIRATGAAVRVYSCDAEVHGGVQRVSQANAVHLVGGGGTDMRPGIALVERQRPLADTLVILTDGYVCAWPKAKPHVGRVVVGLLGTHSGRGSLPPWALGVEIGEAPP